MQLPDSHFLARRDWMVLLAAVAAGDVVRGGPYPARASATHVLDGFDVGGVIDLLARYDLNRASMSGPPTLEPRGRRLLEDRAGG